MQNLFYAVILLVVAGYLVVTEKLANSQCKEMMALAQTRSDTLTVYTMKPNTYTTCAQRLR